jgi:hypothetical protein
MRGNGTHEFPFVCVIACPKAQRAAYFHIRKYSKMASAFQRKEDLLQEIHML